MRNAISLALLVMLLPTVAEGQNARQPGRRGPQNQSGATANQGPASQGTSDRRVTAAVRQLLQMDENRDGVLTKEEVTDTRLHDMLNEADRNQDGQVNSSELNNYFSAQLGLRSNTESGMRQGPGSGPPMGPGGMARPGTILPDFLAEQLQLSDRQAEELKQLQAEVDKRLQEILTEDQWKQLAAPPNGGPQSGFGRGRQQDGSGAGPGGGGPGSGRRRGAGGQRGQ